MRAAWGMLAVSAIALVSSAGDARAGGLTAEDLAEKKEGGYVTGLPLFAYSTDIGFGGGARAYYYWNGDRKDPRFATTPYLQRIFLQAFASTRGIQFHWLDYDAPKIFDSPYRIRSQLIFARNINSNYFGLGTDSLQPLHFSGLPGEDFDKYSDYVDAQQQVRNGLAYTKYNQFDEIRPLWIASIERSFFKDRVRVLGGFGLSYASIRDYTGKKVDAVDDTGASVKATEAPTKLREDCDAGKIVGCSGGRENFLRLGLSYDTRDFEPDPNSGVFADLAMDVGTVALGSEYDYVRVLGAARGYWSPVPDKADLVLAGRAMMQVQSKGTPFFSQNSLPFTEDFQNGLGGHRTLRGFKQDRFVGRTMTLVNAELRWTFAKFTAVHQRWSLFLVPFFDFGRPYDNVGQLTYKDWQASYGGAFRIAWNQATIITVDYGISSEDTGLYINFKHQF
ncbi:MAG TPA: BamA/TamA family outer membrane protein [Kofleriaceae bacterium]